MLLYKDVLQGDLSDLMELKYVLANVFILSFIPCVRVTIFVSVYEKDR